MKYIPILVIVLTIVACGAPAPSTPSEGLIQTAIAKTLAVQPAATEAPTSEASDNLIPEPTNTPRPTATPKPTSTPPPRATPTEKVESMEDLRAEFIGATTKFLENEDSLEAIEKISVVRFGEPGVLGIEVNSMFMSQDNQPDLSYDIIGRLAEVFGEAFGGEDSDKLMRIGGGDYFIIHITTYSSDGDYRYQSDTNFETLMKLHDKQMTYEEWVAAANAGFR